MGQTTKIEWADATVNFWLGCSKVSPACEHCYAETWDATYKLGGQKHWGLEAPRYLRVGAAIKECLQLQRKAVGTVYTGPAKARKSMALTPEGRLRVFVNSLSDFFEDRRDLDLPRLEALEVMRRCPNLDFLLLTKRPEKILPLLTRAKETTTGLLTWEWLRDWIPQPPRGQERMGGNPPPNIWLGTTAENQEWANCRVPELLQVPAALHFVSVEPMLGPVFLQQIIHGAHIFDALGGGGFHETSFEPLPAPGRIDWVICGSESGINRRPFEMDWARELRRQCKETGTPIMFKQGPGPGWKGVIHAPGLDGDPCMEFPEVGPRG
jgi:protein gp37